MSDKREFPKSPCYVCKKNLSAPNSQLWSDDFKSRFAILLSRHHDSVSELLTSNHAEFTNAVTSAYFDQFYLTSQELVEQSRGLGITISNYLEEMKRITDPKYRLERILAREFNKWPFLLIHDSCIPHELEGGGYSIGLSRIDTPEKALAWSMHLNEKTWFDARGWIKFLEDLFGRERIA